VTIVLAAILWLAPQLPQSTARNYAGLIAWNAEKRGIDPLLVVAIIHVESRWDERAVSAKSSWGLAQIHVSATTNPELRGYEKALFNPAVSIHHAVRMLAMWKAWHEKSCGNRKHPHWAHYQGGYRTGSLRNRAWVRKVRKVYAALRNRFRNQGPVARAAALTERNCDV
jgi:hypothetical protein